jgi:hypothetical protein
MSQTDKYGNDIKQAFDINLNGVIAKKEKVLQQRN